MRSIARVLAVFALCVASVHAQEFPGRPVHWILSQPPGSSPDISARLIADGLSKGWGQQVVVDKKDPGKLAAANEGTKTFGGMMSQLLNVATGMNLLQVPYNGVAPALQDTVVGRTQVVLVSSAAMSPYLKRGDLRPIAVTSATRVSGLESVPTMAESYPGFEYVGWFALVAPAGTPEPIVRKVNADVNAVLARDDVQKRLLELGAINEGPGTPEQLAQFLKDERVRWAKLVKDINLQPE